MSDVPAVEVRLSRDEELLAAKEGYERRVYAIEHGLRARHYNGSIWGGNIEGAAAELAVSKFLELPWTTFGYRGQPPHPVCDVGDRTDVRWAQSDRRPLLYLDPKHDNPELVFVLVSGFSPVFRLHGYIKGSDGMYVGRRVHFPERQVIVVEPHELKPLRTARSRRSRAAA